MIRCVDTIAVLIRQGRLLSRSQGIDVICCVANIHVIAAVPGSSCEALGGVARCGRLCGVVGGEEVVGRDRSRGPGQSVGVGQGCDVGPEVVDVGVDVCGQHIGGGGRVEGDLDPQGGPQEGASL